MTATGSFVAAPPRHLDAAGTSLAVDLTRDGVPLRISARVPGGAPVPLRADATVAALLLPAMRSGRSLQVGGPLSPRLGDALPGIQDLLHGWDARFRTAEVVVPDGTAAPTGGAPGVACFFTAGVDSTYTALERREEITELVYVHGFDVHLRATRLRRRVADAVRRAATELGLPLVEVETDLRHVTDRELSWGLAHGGALAFVALLLAGRAGRVLVPSTHTDDYPHPAGSSVDLASRWSTEAVAMGQHGGDVTRVAKVARLAGSEPAMRWLRVCWENRSGAYNCGRCAKCVRTMVSLHLAGSLGRCETLPSRLDLRQVAATVPTDRSGRWFTEENLREAEARDDEPLARALRTSLAAAPRPSRLRRRLRPVRAAVDRRLGVR